jgi:hypothetical protein
VSQEAHRQDDRIIDLVIGLEALLLGDMSVARDELSYRASLRAAHLLHSAQRPIGDVFKQVKDAYGARSTLAHGGELKGTSEAVYAQARGIEALLRAGIGEVLRRPEFEDASAKPWDDLILHAAPVAAPPAATD